MSMQATYVCPYCGSEHDEPRTMCCHEFHSEPRWAYVDQGEDELKQRLDVIECSIHRLDWLDFQTRSDKAALASLRNEQRSIREELAMRTKGY
jgi:hypothetical protein